MTKYVGLKCPVCGKTFTAEDDIVVCPQCGAPYHRDCYAKAGKCVFEDKHGTPDAWMPPKHTNESSTSNRTKQCPRCGTYNSENALFCEHCGQALSANQQTSPNPAPPYTNQNNPQNNFPPFYGPYGPNPMPGGTPYYQPTAVPNPNETIDDIPVGEIAQFVQSNTQYYLPVFMNLKRFGKNRFNFSAFLFPGAWMLYRKLYKAGSIVTTVMFALYIVSAWVTEQILNPIYQALFLETGITGNTLFLDDEQIRILMELISQMPTYKLFLMMVPTLIFIVQLVLMFVFGFNGNRMYLKHCLSKIKTIRQETARPAETAVRMQEEGGVNIPIAIGLGICYMILSYIPSIFY
ncbi:MAG: Prokaryotic RING finger family 1 [Oscillospiraceae bacterium]|jgi:uncharacterized Zn ribbon protein